TCTTLLTVTVGAVVARATTVTVPDDFATIQLAIDSAADTVMIREGTYPERIRVGLTSLIMGLPGSRPRMQGLTVVPGDGFDGLHVKSCAFDGAVDLESGQPFANVTFDLCSLDSGIVMNVSEVFDFQLLAVYRSRIRG